MIIFTLPCLKSRLIFRFWEGYLKFLRLSALAISCVLSFRGQSLGTNTNEYDIRISLRISLSVAKQVEPRCNCYCYFVGHCIDDRKSKSHINAVKVSRDYCHMVWDIPQQQNLLDCNSTCSNDPYAIPASESTRRDRFVAKTKQEIVRDLRKIDGNEVSFLPTYDNGTAFHLDKLSWWW
jgi:hypothetical protein